MDSSDISRLYFQHRAYMDATKKEKEISNSRMSPKNISDQSNGKLGCNLTQVTWVNLG